MIQRAQEPCDNAALSAGADGNGNLNGNELITRHVCDGVEYTYVTPLSRNTGLDFLAASIRTKDLNTVRIVVVCQYANEAAQLMQELGKRCIGCLLINEPTKASDTGVRLWNDGVRSPNLSDICIFQKNQFVSFDSYSTQPWLCAMMCCRICRRATI